MRAAASTVTLSASLAFPPYGARRRLSYCRGFSLIELLVTVALAVIVLAIAVPGYRTLQQENRVATLTNEVVGAIAAARSEAVRRGRSVVLCRSAGGSACEDGSDWSDGWLIRAQLADGSTQIVLLWEAVGGGVEVTGPATGITFVATGAVNAPSGFVVKDPGCSGERVRNVSVALSGLSTVTRSDCP